MSTGSVGIIRWIRSGVSIGRDTERSRSGERSQVSDPHAQRAVSGSIGPYSSNVAAVNGRTRRLEVTMEAVKVDTSPARSVT